MDIEQLNKFKNILLDILFDIQKKGINVSDAYNMILTALEEALKKDDNGTK